ncbi:MAG: hypothetical protein V4609_15170 [Pseudomonadota bacterium]
MHRLRLILTWLIFLALPLQGLAAASMLLCGTGPEQAVHHGVAEHSHSTPAGHADHAGHPAPEHGAPGVSGIDSAAATGTDSASSHHGCTVCAFCVHGLATGGGGAARLATAAPEPLPGWVRVSFDSPSLPVPDKPPRA